MEFGGEAAASYRYDQDQHRQNANHNVMFAARVRDGVVLATVFLFSAGLALPGLVILTAVVLAGAVTGTWRWTPTRLDRPLAFLAAAAVLSTLLSPWRAVGIEPLLLLVATMLVSVGGAAAYSPRGGRGLALVAVWVAGAIPAAVVGLARARPDAGLPAALPTLGPNGLGTTMAVAAVLAAALAATARSALRWAAAAAAGLLAVATAATYARGAWAALAAGLLMVVVTAPDRRRKFAVAAGAAAVLALVGAVAVHWPAAARKARSAVSLGANRDRLVLWETALRIFAAHPVLGTGFGTFQAAYERYRPADAPQPEAPFAHNLLLNSLAEMGVVGAAALVTLCGAGLAAAWRWMSRSPPGAAERATATALLAAIVTLLVHQLFDGTVLSVHVGFGFFALLALAAAREGRPPDGRPSQ
ncbi:MAG: O-antigen ligase family protein [Armatimonadota bacterium]|nr:O-antigen ligase family protein [Armatimonadota bacterium]MDR7534415.1 O-antigen ligase family protein [Armatimonadota bacterium]